jgi:hypothetical protein
MSGAGVVRHEDASPAIHSAVAYLLRQRNQHGWWTDFDTLAGPSTEWTSAFVALALAQTSQPEARAVAQATWMSLRRHRWWSAGWGFNTSVPSDADTTIWVLRLAAAMRASPGRRAHRFLRGHINDDGAIATYAHAHAIQAFTRLRGISFSGWCGAHACVTAAGAGLRELPERERVLTWLRKAQGCDGSWTAYWWCSRHYATALACEALGDVAGPGDLDRVSRATRWTIEDLERREDTLSPFELAFALRTLLCDREGAECAPFVLDRLSREQRADGSWMPSARLRIPPPGVTDPETFSAWFEGGRGGGSVQSDKNASFTTAAVLQALNAVGHCQTAH